MFNTLILGHGRHGKDTVAEYLRDEMDMEFKSSSEAVGELAVYPHLKDKHGYESFKECFDDRHNHRDEWKRLISEYNTPDKSRLCTEVTAMNSCYVGLRCPIEYEASKHLFDLVVWVDRSVWEPDDPSMGIEYDEDAMLLIDNNASMGELDEQIEARLGFLRYVDEFY